jgi:deoxyribodipyrimidine photolyase-related protein
MPSVCALAVSAVRTRTEANSFTAGLQAHVKEFRPRRLLMLEAAEWRARRSQLALSNKLGVEVILSRNTHFLCEQYPPKETPGKKLILENFYRAMRKQFGVLVEDDGSPVGAAWNFDAENRKPYNCRPVLGLKHLDEAERQRLQQQAKEFLEKL